METNIYRKKNSNIRWKEKVSMKNWHPQSLFCWGASPMLRCSFRPPNHSRSPRKLGVNTAESTTIYMIPRHRKRLPGQSIEHRVSFSLHSGLNQHCTAAVPERVQGQVLKPVVILQIDNRGLRAKSYWFNLIYSFSKGNLNQQLKYSVNRLTDRLLNKWIQVERPWNNTTPLHSITIYHIPLYYIMTCCLPPS